MRRAYGKGLSDIFGLAPAPTLISRTLPRPSAAVTEIRCNIEHNGLSRPLAREDAFLLTLQLTDCREHELWIEGKARSTGPLPAGTACLYDLRSDPRVNSISPFHNLHFYFTRAALTAAAGGRDISYIDRGCHDPGIGVPAPVLHALGRSLLPAFERPCAASTAFVDHVIAAAADYIVHNFCKVSR